MFCYRASGRENANETSSKLKVQHGPLWKLHFVVQIFTVAAGLFTSISHANQYLTGD